VSVLSTVRFRPTPVHAGQTPVSPEHAGALVEARLSTAAELAHEISVSGNTPTLKNKLSRAVVELNGAFQYFFAQIVPSKPDGL
jgi:hypothetical protein